MKNGIIFDLDGTLWDSSQQVVDSWNEILKTYEKGKYQITLEDMQGAMGLAMTDIGRKLWPSLEEEKMIPLLQRCMEFENQYLLTHPGTLYPGEEETLRNLSRHYSLFIVSNAQKGYIEAYLSSTGMGRYFQDHLSWGDTKEAKEKTMLLMKEKHHLSKAIYVGDTAMDEIATRKAKLPFVHAAYGFGQAKSPDGAISSLSELEEVAAILLPL